MSLKQKLLETLRENGRIDLIQLQSLCNAYPAKMSTAEKRLREFREPLHKDYHPEVKVEMKNGYINAYVWSTNISEPGYNQIPQKPTHYPFDCPSYHVFKVYCLECQDIQKVKINTLF